MSNTMIQSGHGMLLNRRQWTDIFRIQRVQKSLQKSELTQFYKEVMKLFSLHSKGIFFKAV